MQGANFKLQEDYPFQKETGIIINVGYEVYKQLGAGFLEIVYKDAFEYEFQLREISYQREKEYVVKYKDTILKLLGLIIEGNILQFCLKSFLRNKNYEGVYCSL